MKNLQRFQNLILILLSLIILTSCNNGGIVIPDTTEQESILLNVEYQPGGNFNGLICGCVPSATCMNVNYLGVNVSIEDVRNAGVVEYKSEIITYAQNLGFKAKNVQLSIDEIMSTLKKDYPVICCHEFSLFNDGLHASLIIGVDLKEKILTTHDPNTVFGAFYERSFEEFEALSNSPQQGKYDTVVIYEGSEPWK